MIVRRMKFIFCDMRIKNMIICSCSFDHREAGSCAAAVAVDFSIVFFLLASPIPDPITHQFEENQKMKQMENLAEGKKM